LYALLLFSVLIFVSIFVNSDIDIGPPEAAKLSCNQLGNLGYLQ